MPCHARRTSAMKPGRWCTRTSPVPIDGHRLQVLAAHDGARTAPPRGAQLAQDAGGAAQPLPCRADAGDLGFPPACHAAPQDRLRLYRIAPPDLPGIDDLHAAVDDAQDRRLVRPPFDDQPIVACLLQLTAQQPRADGEEVEPRQRRLAAQAVAPAGRGGGADQRPGQEEELVGGRQGIDAGRYFVVQDARREPSPAEIAFGQRRTPAARPASSGSTGPRAAACPCSPE